MDYEYLNHKPIRYLMTSVVRTNHFCSQVAPCVVSQGLNVGQVSKQ